MVHMTKELSPDDEIAAKRLAGLLDYIDALAKLDERPATELAQYRLADGYRFVLHQHESAGLPGVSLDLRDADGPIWFRIERLQRLASPVADEAIRPWIEISNDPAKAPIIKEAVHLRVLGSEKIRMIEAGEARNEIAFHP
jgi:hypothetical protein